ncbi:UDP-2,4-diacetamido-2,4, 6-trideoxy-beta-L-altropyranose hydrolase [Gammaproteobacteria bacterium]
MPGPLLLRADASFGIGTGHVMRLIALVEAWQEITGTDASGKTEDIGSALLLGRISIPQLRQRLVEAGIGLWDLLVSHPDPGDLVALTNLAEVLQPAWIVLDGYHFDSAYQAATRALGIPVLILDDMAHHGQYHADLLLNQNINADGLHYSVGADTRLLLGSRYCMLRAELRATRNAIVENVKYFPKEGKKEEKLASRPWRLLVTMGGADHRGLSFLALQALAELGAAWEAKVVMGSAAYQSHQLCQLAAELPKVEIHTDVRDMGPLMVWADMALSAAGSTTWELACLGVPALLVVVADNQSVVARTAASIGCAIDLGEWKNLTASGLAHALAQLAANEQQRTAMSIAGRALVDGEGATRVARIMLELI